MSEIDDKIREALRDSSESEELFEEKNLISEVVAPFRGKRRWINFLGLAYGLAGMAVFIWAAVEFFSADVVSEQIHWAAIGFFGVLFVSFIKVYFWMEMHSNRVLREVKRVELLVLQMEENRLRER